MAKNPTPHRHNYHVDEYTKGRAKHASKNGASSDHKRSSSVATKLSADIGPITRNMYTNAHDEVSAMPSYQEHEHDQGHLPFFVFKATTFLLLRKKLFGDAGLDGTVTYTEQAKVSTGTTLLGQNFSPKALFDMVFTPTCSGFQEFDKLMRNNYKKLLDQSKVKLKYAGESPDNAERVEALQAFWKEAWALAKALKTFHNSTTTASATEMKARITENTQQIAAATARKNAETARQLHWNAAGNV